MSAKKSDINSSKTAHVMNLLSRGRAPEPPADTAPADSTAPAADETAPQPAAAPSPAPAPAHSASPIPQASPIISMMSADAAAAAAIKEALEEELLEEEAAEAAEAAELQAAHESFAARQETSSLSEEDHVGTTVPLEEDDTTAPLPEEPSPEPDSKPAPEETPLPLVEAAPVPEPEPTQEPDSPETPQSEDPDPAQEEMPELQASSPLPEPEVPQPEEPVKEAAPSFATVNIIEELVEEEVDRYIQMFGLCDCPRCRADVAALALSSLPPKYVVMDTAHRGPRLSIYRGRYSAAVTAQILRACKTVYDDPRHDLT